MERKQAKEGRREADEKDISSYLLVSAILNLLFRPSRHAVREAGGKVIERCAGREGELLEVGGSSRKRPHAEYGAFSLKLFSW